MSIRDVSLFSILIFKRLVLMTAVVLVLFFCVGCTIDMDMLDRAQTDIQFSHPANVVYTKDLSFQFQYKLNLNIPDAEIKRSWIEVYEGKDCSKDGYLYSQTARDPKSTAFAVSSLEDGKVYSVIVYVHVNSTLHKSVCSPWVGVDTQPPEAVAVQYPSGNNYTSLKAFTAQWTPSTDNGISGLAVTPYRIRLYAQPDCQGAVEKMEDSILTSFYFQNLTHGVTYSVLVSSIDRAGNESPIVCSPYTEIDVYAPGLTLKDPVANPGFTRRSDPEVVIENDSTAGYWCLTLDASFAPTSHTEICPGGGGSENGWHRIRPTRVQLPDSDGLYVYYLWLFRNDGSLVSNSERALQLNMIIFLHRLSV